MFSFSFFFRKPFTFRGEYFPQDNTDRIPTGGGRMPGIARKNKHDHERKHGTVQTELNIWYKKEMIP